MKSITYQRLTLSNIQPSKTPISLCIGYFDGLHLGHQQLVAETVRLAKLHGVESALFTFDPHPDLLLKKKKFLGLLTPLETRIEVAKTLGIDKVFVLDFNEEVMHLAPSMFYQRVLQPLHVQDLVCGFDFRFGYKGQGNIETLQQFSSSQFRVHVIDEVHDQFGKISSTRIFGCLQEGHVDEAANLLGRPYSVKGIVVHGFGNGAKLGYPTANLDTNGYFLPRGGVYAVEVLHRGEHYYGMASIGVHPTINKLAVPVLEVHMFDFNQTIYGDTIEVLFHRFLRPEIKFESVRDLQVQMALDKSESISRFDCK